MLRLHEVAERTGGAVAIAPLDVTLADHSVVQPDVIYVSASRLEIVGDRIEGAPDLLVEVLSPGTSRRDRNEKLKLYAESGVREYWIVDAVERQIEFLVNDSGTFHVALPVDDRYRSAALPRSSSTSESSGGSSTATCRIPADCQSGSASGLLT
jgi:Uma2 family endonuclease